MTKKQIEDKILDVVYASQVPLNPTDVVDNISKEIDIPFHQIRHAMWDLVENGMLKLNEDANLTR